MLLLSENEMYAVEMWTYWICGILCRLFVFIKFTMSAIQFPFFIHIHTLHRSVNNVQNVNKSKSFNRSNASNVKFYEEENEFIWTVEGENFDSNIVDWAYAKLNKDEIERERDISSRVLQQNGTHPDGCCWIVLERFRLSIFQKDFEHVCHLRYMQITQRECRRLQKKRK